MLRNYRIYIKSGVNPDWSDTGLIVADKAKAEKFMRHLVDAKKYSAFKLEPVSYGIATDLPELNP